MNCNRTPVKLSCLAIISYVLLPVSPALGQAVSITLPEIITLALEGNRDLRNQALQRVIEQQVLNAAEQQFDPRITPVLSVGVTQNLSSEPASGNGLSLPTAATGITTDINGSAALSQTAAVSATWLTPLGTDLSVQLDPLATTPLSFQITQPLMRGAGRSVNNASIEQARLAEDQGQLALKQQRIDTITTAITRYTALIQNQEAVRIQEMALERRQQQLEILQALVTAGRRAPVDLFDTERSISNAQRDLIVSRNQLDQANTDLLNLIGTDASLQFSASTAVIKQLFATAVEQTASLDFEELVAIAYDLRPDYQQARLEKDVQRLNLLVAEDNLQWQLDIQGNGQLGDFAESTVGLVATRTFPHPELETDRVRSEVTLEQADNLLLQFQTSIRNNVAVRLGDVRSNLARVEAAKLSTQSAERQLAVDKARFSRGIGGISIFQVITQEQSLVEAQNAQLQADIAFLNSVAELEQTVGITLDSWDTVIDQRLLQKPTIQRD